MRVLFAVGGGASHLFPLVPLAWAFRAAGHELRLAGKRNHIDALTGTGLPCVILGRGPQLSVRERADLLDTNYGQQRWPPDWPAHPAVLGPEQLRLLEVLGRYTVAVADAMADDLVAFAREWSPDLIVHDTLALSAAIAAALTGVPALRHTIGTQDVYRVENRVIDGEPLPECVQMFARFGATAPVEVPPYVDTMPASLFVGAERPATQMRWVPYNGSGARPDGLAGPRRRPRVCVTWGVTLPGALGSAAADPYRDAITAVTAAGVEVLVLARADQVSALGEPPDGVRHLAGVPLNLVLPHCDAIVHHGGEGTAMTAAALGVPQLVITREPMDDHFASRLARTGAAIHLPYHQLEQDPGAAGRIRAAIDALLSDPAHAAGAAALREDIERDPAPAAVADRLTAPVRAG